MIISIGNTIKFINGSSYKDGRSLTTKYTEIPSSYSNTPENEDYEALGIENINIEFNSSYAPIVKIKFIDIRGASLFDGFESVDPVTGEKSNVSNYSSFFRTPYPVFELTIKGYYGKGLKYKLHLTKYTSEFKSESLCFFI